MAGRVSLSLPGSPMLLLLRFLGSACVGTGFGLIAGGAVCVWAGLHWASTYLKTPTGLEYFTFPEIPRIVFWTGGTLIAVGVGLVIGGGLLLAFIPGDRSWKRVLRRLLLWGAIGTASGFGTAYGMGFINPYPEPEPPEATETREAETQMLRFLARTPVPDFSFGSPVTNAFSQRDAMAKGERWSYYYRVARKIGQPEFNEAHTQVVFTGELHLTGATVINLTVDGPITGHPRFNPPRPTPFRIKLVKVTPKDGAPVWLVDDADITPPK